MAHILMWLEGPLQGWGYDSCYDRRETLNFPTKSGVLGMVMCAMGKKGPQKDLLAKLNRPMQVLALNSNLPHLEDFQTIGGNYDEKDTWQNLMVPKKPNGTKPVGGATIVTHRYYIQGGAYAVFLDVPDEMCETISQALISPVWPLFLGRKCCVPSELIFQGAYESLEAAQQAAQTLCESKNRTPSFEVIEGEGEGECVIIPDVPVRFGERKEYEYRRVTIRNMP